MENLKVSLRDLELRKKRFGNIGALDFLIQLERNQVKQTGELNWERQESAGCAGYVNVSNIDSLPALGDTLFNDKLIPDLLLQATSVAEHSGDTIAFSSAIDRVDEKENYPELNLLEANYFLTKKDYSGWLSCVQRYLEPQSLAKITLSEDKSKPIFFRLRAEASRQLYTREKVSVLISAYNAEETIVFSVQSILQQSWKNLEVIIVDDASTDGTWEKIVLLAARDDRLKIIRNEENLGPYVSRNLALDISTGSFITGQDADDWSHPERIEKQVAYLKSYKAKAALSFMLRIDMSGRFTHLSKRSSFSLDGALRKSLISGFFDAEFLKCELGYWDCVKFGADSELIARVEIAIGEKILLMPFCCMFCLDLESSLTNSKVFGISKKDGVGDIRKSYQTAWREWHKTLSKGNTKLGFNEGRKYFNIPKAASSKAN